MNRSLEKLIILTTVIFFQITFIEPSMALPPISYTASNSSSLSAGQSVVYTLTLSEPIICPGGAVTCNVTLNFNNNNSAATSLNQSSIIWQDSEWNQVRTLILTVDSNITYNNAGTFTLSSVASSNAEFYRNYAISITQQISLPLSPSQIAAIAAAEAAALAAKRQIEINNYREILYKKLVAGIRPTLFDYHNAMYLQPTERIVDSITDELFKLLPDLRTSESTINKIADELAFLDNFYNPIYRPTLSIYQQFGIHMVSNRTIARVNAAILGIPIENRYSIESILLIAKQYNFVDSIANLQTRKNVKANQFIAMGILKEEQPFKLTIINGLGAFSESDLDSMEKIKKQIDIQISKVNSRMARTTQIISKISNRK